MIIFLRGGIANRLRTISGFCELYGTSKLKFIWPINNELGAPYQDVFLPRDQLKVYNMKIESSWFKNGKLKRLRRLIVYLRRKPHLFSVLLALELSRIVLNTELARMYDSSYHDSLSVKELDLLFEKNFRKVYFQIPFLSFESCYSPKANYGSSGFDIKHINSGFDFEYFGVHVRRTDNMSSISRLSLHTICQEINLCLTNPLFPDKFYLATDSPEVYSMLSNKFPENIIGSAPENFSRDTRDGITSAVRDLGRLIKAKYLLISPRSTFGYAAARFGGINFKTMLDANK